MLITLDNEVLASVAPGSDLLVYTGNDDYLVVGRVGPAQAHLPTSPLSAPIGAGYSIAFEVFWAAYPRKTGKGAAWKVWQKIKGGHEIHAAIMRGVAACSKSDQWQREGGKYIPLPATWLGQSRWEDEVPTSGAAATVVKPTRVGRVCEECKKHHTLFLGLEDYKGRMLCSFCRSDMEDKEYERAQDELRGEGQ